MVVGHEYCGEVAELGSEVKGLQVGDRVTGEGHITCGYCRNCRAGNQHLCRNTMGVGVNQPGAFAEYFSLPARNVFKLDPRVSNDVASFMDALGNAVHTALSFDLIGEDVLVVGAGPIGAMAVGVCKQVGARHVVVTDVNDYRLKLAGECGADALINVSNGDDELKKTMDRLGMTEAFDVGLEMSGNSHGIQTMLTHMNMGGRIALLGIPPNEISLNFDDIIFKGLTMKGIYGREMFETWYKMQSLLTSGLSERIEPIITHRFSADDYTEGFETMCSGESGKIILNWS
jgi:threonine 3-dehydrogenase